MSSKSKRRAVEPTSKGDDLESNFAVEAVVADASGSDGESEGFIAPLKPGQKPPSSGAGLPPASAKDGAPPAVAGVKRSREDMKHKPAHAGPPAVSAEEQAATFWKAFSASKVAARLTDLEIEKPLAAEHVKSVPATSIPTAGTASTDVSDIVECVKAALPSWKKTFGWKTGSTKRDSGRPEVLIISFSAPRAASMLKPLGVFHTRIAKLFARHMTVEEQQAVLSGPAVTMAVGKWLAKVMRLVRAWICWSDGCH